jgi:hypothetical protein
MHKTSQPTRAAARRAALTAVLVGFAAAGAAAAPAHPDSFRGYSGVRWPSDFQVRSGRCDRLSITHGPRPAAAIASLGERRALNPNAALLVGAHVSDLLPAQVGPELDESDRACMGEVLELGASGSRVTWDNGATGVRYVMWPDAGRDGIAGACRVFHLTATGNYRKVQRKALACETGPGLWQLSGL